MRLTTRVLLLMVALLALALGGSLLLHTWAARQALQEQLELRNRDAAASLALALSQQQGDTVSLQTVAAAHFDTGSYSLVHLVRTDGGAAVRLQRADPATTAPAWFVAALPMSALPGRALVTNGWQELGTVHVSAHSAWAHAALWDACRYTAGLLVLLGLLAAALATYALRAWQRPLRATVNQARALENGRFVEAPEPGLPELKTLTRSMNAMVRRLRKVLSEQAGQLA
jgi:HAMP domain-containing protein